MGFWGPGIGFQEFSAWAPVATPPWSERQAGPQAWSPGCTG